MEASLSSDHVALQIPGSSSTGPGAIWNEARLKAIVMGAPSASTAWTSRSARAATRRRQAPRAWGGGGIWKTKFKDFQALPPAKVNVIVV